MQRTDEAWMLTGIGNQTWSKSTSVMLHPCVPSSMDPAHPTIQETQAANPQGTLDQEQMSHHTALASSAPQ